MPKEQLKKVGRTGQDALKQSLDLTKNAGDKIGRTGKELGTTVRGAADQGARAVSGVFYNVARQLGFRGGRSRRRSKSRKSRHNRKRTRHSRRRRSSSRRRRSHTRRRR